MEILKFIESILMESIILFPILMGIFLVSSNFYYKGKYLKTMEKYLDIVENIIDDNSSLTGKYLELSRKNKYLKENHINPNIWSLDMSVYFKFKYKYKYSKKCLNWVIENFQDNNYIKLKNRDESFKKLGM